MGSLSKPVGSKYGQSGMEICVQEYKSSVIIIIIIIFFFVVQLYVN